MDTDATQIHTLPNESNDIFSLSDAVLAERLEFIEEIGFGNWGSVWLCRAKPAVSADGVVRPLGQKIAVKLVHRNKTSTTAARVRSLWNEMKIVRNFKSDPHPSIIPFHSFIITPSYAIITMTYLPTLIPVEVAEDKAREWFRYLLSGVEFLHKRGVVHNDIKPANILISTKNVPVLVDFGFAEKYDMQSDTAFHSNLSYGTPEYLAPERARGLPHDTRKSDVWSLGITFFEVLTGRTPFEETDGEQFESNEDLERYWSRTMRGKWVGTWSFSQPMEKLLQRMISPNADLRCTATQAMADSFWKAAGAEASSNLHKRASSYNSSIVFEKDMDKLLNMTPSSWKGKKGLDKENMMSPPGLASPDVFNDSTNRRQGLAKSKSQSRVAPPRKRPGAMDLSPIKASPNPSPYTGTKAGKENIMAFNMLATVANSDKKPHHHQRSENTTPDASFASSNAGKVRRPFGMNLSNLPQPRQPHVASLSKKPSGHSHGAKAVKILGELRTNTNMNPNDSIRSSTSAKDRVREWEREKERLREIERLQELERERDVVHRRDREARQMEKERRREGREEAREREGGEQKQSKNASVKEIRIPATPGLPMARKSEDRENVSRAKQSPMLPSFSLGSPFGNVLNMVNDTPQSRAPRTTMGSAKNIFKHSIKASIDKTMQFYKSSTIAQVTSGRSTPARGFSFDISRPNPDATETRKESWEMAAEAGSSAISPISGPRYTAQNERMGSDAQNDRMTDWMKNVDRVIEDAKADFQRAGQPYEAPLAPLPPPLSRNVSQNRTSRLPRRVLAASQIFQADEHGNLSPMGDSSTANSTFLSVGNTSRGSTSPTSPLATTTVPTTPEVTMSPLPAETPSKGKIEEVYTPSRPRRATVSTRSPEPPVPVVTIDEGTPSKKKEKSKSHGNLFQRQIAPLDVLEAEINRVEPPPPTPRLSDVVDRSLFIAAPLRSRDNLLDCTIEYSRSPSLDDLTSSPCHVEPYPQRPRASYDVPIPDTPSRHRIEGVYDRFLMATSGVKRLGKGYQSDNIAPAVGPTGSATLQYGKGRSFYSTRRPMPPPVSSADQFRAAASVDELGNMSYAASPPHADSKQHEGHGTASLVRKAIKLMVPKSNASRRLSRIGA